MQFMGVLNPLPKTPVGALGNRCLYGDCVKNHLALSIDSDTMFNVSGMAEMLDQMKKNPNGVRFSELQKICEHYFGKPRQSGSSHCIYKTPWPGDPRVNIQNHKGKAKPYQVKQVLLAVEKIEVSRGSCN